MKNEGLNGLVVKDLPADCLPNSGARTLSFWNGCWALRPSFQNVLDYSSPWLQWGKKLKRDFSLLNFITLKLQTAKRKLSWRSRAEYISNRDSHREVPYLKTKVQLTNKRSEQRKTINLALPSFFSFWLHYRCCRVSKPMLDRETGNYSKIIFLGYVLNSLNGWSWSQLCKRKDKSFMYRNSLPQRTSYW